MILELEGIERRFGGTRALDGASLAVEAGRVLGVVGANGAGKSTLLKVAAGQVVPDAGTVRVAGEQVRLNSPRQAQAAGIVLMPQELMAIGGMSVADNVLMGHEPTRWRPYGRRSRAQRARTALERVGLALDPLGPVDDLEPSDQRMVALAGALHRDARVVILDEPTASMRREDARTVLETVRALAAQGMAVVVVSHRFGELLAVCDDVMAMRNGRTSWRVPRSELTAADLMGAILTDEAPTGSVAPASSRTGTVALRARGLRGASLDGVDLDVWGGEILGVTGLVGSGVADLLAFLGGARRPAGGEIVVGARPGRFRCPADALSRGVAYLPAERAVAGFGDLPLRFNAALPDLSALARWGVVTAGLERRGTREILDGMGLGRRLDHPLSSLSGGNRQKVLVARCLRAGAQVLVLDDPTVGVDVAGRADLHEILRDLARKGRAVVVGASEPEELLGLVDRVVVLDRGRVAQELMGDEITAEALATSTALAG